MKASTNIRFMRSGTDAVLVDTNNGSTFGVNAVGATIWTKLQQNIPVEQIINEISAEFSVSSEVVREDVHRFLESLEKHELAK